MPVLEEYFNQMRIWVSKYGTDTKKGRRMSQEELAATKKTKEPPKDPETAVLSADTPMVDVPSQPVGATENVRMEPTISKTIRYYKNQTCAVRVNDGPIVGHAAHRPQSSWSPFFKIEGGKYGRACISAYFAPPDKAGKPIRKEEKTALTWTMSVPSEMGEGELDDFQIEDFSFHAIKDEIRKGETIPLEIVSDYPDETIEMLIHIKFTGRRPIVEGYKPEDWSGASTETKAFMNSILGLEAISIEIWFKAPANRIQTYRERCLDFFGETYRKRQEELH